MGLPAVTPTNADLAYSDGLMMIWEVEPEGTRTVGQLVS